jgi:hypothetical protein
MFAAVAALSLLAVPAVAQVHIDGPGIHVEGRGPGLNVERGRRGGSDVDVRIRRDDPNYRVRAERCRTVVTRETRPSGRVVVTRERRCR